MQFNCSEKWGLEKGNKMQYYFKREHKKVASMVFTKEP
jgi:hypothetical protein